MKHQSKWCHSTWYSEKVSHYFHDDLFDRDTIWLRSDRKTNLYSTKERVFEKDIILNKPIKLKHGLNQALEKQDNRMTKAA